MKKQFLRLFTTITFLFMTTSTQAMTSEVNLTHIKNFRHITSLLSSSGMPSASEFKLIQNKGYRHIINLIPGDFNKENHDIRALNMSFDQIPVDWENPTLADFQKFVVLMNNYKQAPVLVHCRLNYRASAFAYLYQITQLGISHESAQKNMLTVWQPEGTWLKYINMVRKHYQNIL
ncbi:protein tyrosine phosphatase family protein [Pseudoalteromonas denitrificans]|uniref:Predicted phosphohydrolase, protein tyrosine phosphatase (PTP) superfamily, DUF442 family n=1 Tax=Pseudoalteromonas denitrificans DSM 6059 TaxID=1123010 RepID=A0A1I1TF58_9GAMM|nr:protein tyrosine phosphatase family protein [Pseudoalteromonas denitrificans]SFD57206.1 Predicted phosphohydrolase, protein tyrosine phosphatase (PTP) superfamily, DUF442 family [Pseudoalteromonas denitrificans DSM 6059]